MNMSNLRVAVVSSGVGKSPSYIPYSFVFDEAIRLANLGIVVHIIRPIYEPRSQSCGIIFHGKSSLRFHRFVPFLIKHINRVPLHGYLIFPGQLLSLFEYGQTIFETVKHEHIDLIHAHFAYPEGFAGFLAKARTNVPLIVTLHGYDILTHPSVGYGIRLDIRIDKIIRKVISDSDAIVTESTATYEEALKAGACEDKTHLIFQAIDTERFNTLTCGDTVREKHALEDKFILFTVRSHQPKYGIEYVLRAMKRICEETDTVHLIVGGDGPLKEYHEDLARHLGITENVTFTGVIPTVELPIYYAACNVAVIPSLQEAFGLAVTEGMASGKPVIGSAVGGIPDQIVNGTNGFLVSPGCPDEIGGSLVSSTLIVQG